MQVEVQDNSDELRTETAAWFTSVNASQHVVNWHMTVVNAHCKLKSVYSKIVIRTEHQGGFNMKIVHSNFIWSGYLNICVEIFWTAQTPRIRYDLNMSWFLVKF